VGEWLEAAQQGRQERLHAGRYDVDNVATMAWIEANRYR